MKIKNYGGVYIRESKKKMAKTGVTLEALALPFRIKTHGHSLCNAVAAIKREIRKANNQSRPWGEIEQDEGIFGDTFDANLASGKNFIRPRAETK